MTLESAELKLNGKNFLKFLGNISKFPNYLQTSWPTFQIPNFF